MARIIGGIGTSHVPTIATAFDKGKKNHPHWKPPVKGYQAIRQGQASNTTDVLVLRPGETVKLWIEKIGELEHRVA